MGTCSRKFWTFLPVSRCIGGLLRVTWLAKPDEDQQQNNTTIVLLQNNNIFAATLCGEVNYKGNTKQYNSLLSQYLEFKSQHPFGCVLHPYIHTNRWNNRDSHTQPHTQVERPTQTDIPTTSKDTHRNPHTKTQPHTDTHTNTHTPNTHTPTTSKRTPDSVHHRKLRTLHPRPLVDMATWCWYLVTMVTIFVWLPCPLMSHERMPGRCHPRKCLETVPPGSKREISLQRINHCFDTLFL